MNGVVLSRAGKATGKHCNWWNVQKENGEVVPIDLGKVKEFNVANVAEVSVSTNEEKNAKNKELENWRRFDVYTSVPEENQPYLSTRWVVVTRKADNSVKARLVARRFEEEDDFAVDSPAVSKDCIRIIFGMAGIFNWELAVLDVKAAFLQGDNISGTFFLSPLERPENQESCGNLKRPFTALVMPQEAGFSIYGKLL